jgi:hypothetical protein
MLSLITAYSTLLVFLGTSRPLNLHAGLSTFRCSILSCWIFAGCREALLEAPGRRPALVWKQVPSIDRKDE